MALADGETLRTFATMTTEANPELALIQHRMPVIIEEADWRVWLGEEEGDVQALLHPIPVDRFRVWPVGRKVNFVKNDGPELLDPLPEAEPESRTRGSHSGHHRISYETVH